MMSAGNFYPKKDLSPAEIKTLFTKTLPTITNEFFGEKDTAPALKEIAKSYEGAKKNLKAATPEALEHARETATSITDNVMGKAVSHLKQAFESDNDFSNREFTDMAYLRQVSEDSNLIADAHSGIFKDHLAKIEKLAYTLPAVPNTSHDIQGELYLLAGKAALKCNKAVAPAELSNSSAEQTKAYEGQKKSHDALNEKARRFFTKAAEYGSASVIQEAEELSPKKPRASSVPAASSSHVDALTKSRSSSDPTRDGGLGR